MKVDTFQCDGCGKQKEKANHWFKGFIVVSRIGDGPNAGVMVIQWDVNGIQTVADHTPETADAHLCGAACVTEWLSKNLLN